MRNTVEWVFAVALALFLSLLLREFVIENYEISGNSMMPTFQSGDFVFAEKVSYRYREVGINDIVIISSKELMNKNIIKRVVGLEGDNIEIKEGSLFRNGEKVSEDYLGEEAFNDFESIVVPGGEVFVLGDNRNNSSDSRVFGTFEYDDIQARVFIEIFDNPLRFY
jgi:signal peptidase I